MSQSSARSQEISKTNSRDKNKKKCAPPSASKTSYDTIPYYKRYEKFDDVAIHVMKNATIPHIEPNSEKYTPIPYIFRIPDKSNSKCLSAMVRCPPFHVQLDHAIAVVWSLYAADETDIPLGLNQLQWAYGFLQNVKDKDSSYPRDVEHAMESISDEIIEQYADMAECLSTPPASMTSFHPEANSTKRDKEIDKECPCAAESSVRFADADDACAAAASTTDSAACNNPPEYPFSVTYNDIRMHNRTVDDALKKLENVCNHEKESTFLTEMRKDQLQKILGELDRLHDIEKYIITTNKDFQPCLDESDQELKDFISRKLKGCQGVDSDGQKKKCAGGPKGQKKDKKSPSKSSIVCTDEKRGKRDQGTQDEKNSSKTKNEDDEETDQDDDENDE